MEQMAVTGNSEKPSVVASRMQLVFSTLEVYSSTVNIYTLSKKMICSLVMFLFIYSAGSQPTVAKSVIIWKQYDRTKVCSFILTKRYACPSSNLCHGATNDASLCPFELKCQMKMLMHLIMNYLIWYTYTTSICIRSSNK